MTDFNFEPSGVPVSFTASRPLAHDIQTVALIEGISRADVVRRAVLADMRARKEEWLRSQRQLLIRRIEERSA